MTNETRAFHVGDILTAMTGRLVSPRHMDGVYDILNWLTGESLFTHQLPRASREAEPYLRDWFRDLAGLEIPELDGEEEVNSWLANVAAIHGTFRDVPRLPVEAHTSINPIAELKMMRPDAPIITVNVEDQ